MLKKYVMDNVKTYADVMKFGHKMARVLNIIRLVVIAVLFSVSAILTQIYLAPWFGLTEWRTDTATFVKYIYLTIVSNITFFAIIIAIVIGVFNFIMPMHSKYCSKLVLKVFEERGDMDVISNGLLSMFGVDTDDSDEDNGEGDFYDDNENDWGEYEEC